MLFELAVGVTAHFWKRIDLNLCVTLGESILKQKRFINCMWRMKIKDLVKRDIRKQQKLILEFEIWKLEKLVMMFRPKMWLGHTWLEQIEIAYWY